MAALDPRDPPSENRTVTVGYLNELYAKADRLHRFETAVRTLLEGPVDEIDAASEELLDLLEKS